MALLGPQKGSFGPRKALLGAPEAEMEKRADNADISVLFFGGCANFLAVYAQTN